MKFSCARPLVGERIASSMGWGDTRRADPVEDAHLSGDLMLFGLADTANPQRAGHHLETGDGPCVQFNRRLRGAISVSANAALRHLRQDVILGAIRTAGRLLDERDG
jgi:hypothetical protein